MSLFLGPIHHIMYGKIKFQDNLCEYIIDRISEKTGKDFAVVVNEVISPLPKGELENVIDKSNIHGSLQAMVSTVESRLALIVSEAIKKGYLSLEDIKIIAKKFGKENSFDKDIKLEEAYQTIGTRILNGMPCDRVEEVLVNDSKSVKWIDRIDIHKDYWNEVERDSSDFYEIRSSLIEGLFESTDIRYAMNDDREFELRRN